MIHVFIGTKAQLIKMAPIMMELQNRGVEYNFIFSGQHQETIENLQQNFNLKKPDCILHTGKDITTIFEMLLWGIKIIYLAIKKRKSMWKTSKPQGIVINHGDTFSTLLGTILGKIAGLKNAHIESGLRSFDIWNPFPEEVIRRIVFNLTDYYFAPGEWAISNLESYSGKKINIKHNTLYDSLKYIKSKTSNLQVKIPDYPFAVVSLHRFENLAKETHVKKIIEQLIKISQTIRLIFILHKPTEKKLKEFGLYELLETSGEIELRPRYDYQNFITLLIYSEFLVSDGGSNQEECYYLGKPCILFRKATERKEGLGINVILSEFDDSIINEFVSNYSRYKKEGLEFSHSPSNQIVSTLLEKL